MNIKYRLLLDIYTRLQQEIEGFESEARDFEKTYYVRELEESRLKRWDENNRRENFILGLEHALSVIREYLEPGTKTPEKDES